MITADPGRRRSVLDEVQAILAREAPPEDRDLLLSLAPVVYADMPDAMALGLPPDALAARIREYFRFVVRTMPPAHQLYRGLPGIHVVARSLTEAEARTTGSTHGGHYEISVVETHTPDAPFIFESLKNFLLGRACGSSRRSTPIFTRAPAVGADRVDRRSARGRQQGAPLPLPRRADRAEGPAAADRAPDPLAPEERVPGRRGLRAR